MGKAGRGGNSCGHGSGNDAKGPGFNPLVGAGLFSSSFFSYFPSLEECHYQFPRRGAFLPKQ